MKTGVRTREEHIEEALVAANMAWWELEFPSGAMSFSKNKTDMLGYDKEKFVHFMHFTELIHEDDHDACMQAMTDHYTGKKPYYESVYRIKAADGSYRTFADRGCIVERNGESFIVAGIVRDITDIDKPN